MSRVIPFAMLALLSACVGDGGRSGAVAPTAPPTQTVTPSPSSTPSPSPTATATIDPECALSGGDTTVHDVSRNAFSLPAANLDGQRQSDFFVGNSFFNRNWVTAPSSTSGLDGLGPVFNARSCSACHFKDGRGAPPADADDNNPSLLFRLSIGGAGAHGGANPHPTYGDQLQPVGLLGVPGEGKAEITYIEVPGTFDDGEAYSLRRPVYTFTDLSFGPLDPQVMVSPRVAPALIGLGLLSAVSEEAILMIAADQAEAAAVSGRANYVWDVRRQEARLGRFGWKANQPTLEQQNAGAFIGDIGLTSELFPESNCTPIQTACVAAPNGGEPELDPEKLEFVTFYTHLLAVPARRDIDDPAVVRGEEVLATAGCTSCHVPTLTTATLEGFPEVSRQTIHPYTDLLLHDMGDELADGRPDFLADGREWRTPPLWGIGLVQTVNRHTNFLHDGRARGLLEAILWHGGEAEDSRQAVLALDSQDRQALIRFLESL